MSDKKSVPILKTVLMVIGIAFVIFVIFLLIFDDSSEKNRSAKREAVSYICSRAEGDHVSDYYLINEMLDVGSPHRLPLRQKVTDVTIRVSTIAGEWSTSQLCDSAVLDLPDSQWRILTIGKDCALGAAVEPCDISDSESDAAGLSAITLEQKGTNKLPIFYRKDALLKVTGNPVK